MLLQSETLEIRNGQRIGILEIREAVQSIAALLIRAEDQAIQEAVPFIEGLTAQEEA
tara:strand:+ start:293 stop:463 length:171 start_codon:yes stop_codon:yes gene_type:complete